MTSATTAIEAWVADTCGSAVISTMRLVGGMSSLVHRHDLADGRRVVSRQIDDADWLAREPDLIDREAAALRLVQPSPLLAPELVATDPGAARMLTTFLDGRMIVDADGLRARLRAMADVAATIATTPLPNDHGLPPWSSWAPADPTPPEWGDRRLWAELIEAYEVHPHPPNGPTALLHRDLHPLNLLWNDDGSVAVVDWVNTCIGHPHAELGHLRWNLAVLVDIDAADELLAHYLAITGDGAYDPYWDLAPLMSHVDWPFEVDAWQSVGRTDLDRATVLRRSEAFTRHVLDH